MSDITSVLAALKTLEAGLTGVVTVFEDLPATISNAQLPAILHEEINGRAERLTGGILEETYTVPTRLLAHAFPKQADGLLSDVEALRRAYADMVLDNPTVSGTCQNAEVVEWKIQRGQAFGVECAWALLSVRFTLYRRKGS